MYSYGLIGNCQISSLVHESGSINWLCLPRIDSEPIFGRLLDKEGGHFSISLPHQSKVTSSQYYLENTNILVTELRGDDSSGVRITDFCPRFEQFGRMFRPMMLIRMLEPLGPGVSISVDCEPINGWTKKPLKKVRGNSHFRFEGGDEPLRLTTSMPLTYLDSSTPFQIQGRVYFALTWGSTISEDLPALCENYFLQTRDYWRTWVKHCAVPTLFQKEVIRSALALKLHCYEDTGAILAATTTSLPEEWGHTRNWDYRFCWLRDAYFTLTAFHNLGHFEEMEGFLRFLSDIAFQSEISRDRLAPVYTLSRELPLPEKEHSRWAGYQGSQPVRSNNQAAEHIQNDVYGEMILAFAPIYFDERFAHLREHPYEKILERLALFSIRSIGEKDAGLWELRNTSREHSFTNLMIWAGLERIKRLQHMGFLKSIKIDASKECEKAVEAVKRGIKNGILRSATDDSSMDCALSHLSLLRFPDVELARKTVTEIRNKLSLPNGHDAFFFRYLQEDDFGVPDSAFLACSFWVAQALANLGHMETARSVLEKAATAANHLGLLSEHYDPVTRRQLGNFPQTYSHVGLINAAFAVSPRWSEVL